MVQLGNGVRLSNSNPMRQSGAASAGAVCRQVHAQGGALRCWYTGEATSGNARARVSHRPAGYYPPAVWLLAPGAGAICARDTAAGSSTASASITGGRNAQGTSAGAGAASASVAGVGSLSVSAAGLATAAAAITGAVNLSCAAAGAATCSGSIAGAVQLSGASAGVATASAGATGAVSLSASAAGVATCTASITGAVNLAASSAGVATASASIRAIAELAGTATVGGVADPLSPSSLAAAVWNAAAAAFVSDGTTGAALTLIRQILQGRTVTDPDAGTITVYDDDDEPLLTASLWQDADGTVPYSGSGAERRDRLA